MIAGLFLVFFWLGFRRYDVDQELIVRQPWMSSKFI